MRFVALFTVTLNIADPIRFYADKETQTLLLLRDTYQGKCFQDKFILEIISVEETSSCSLMTYGSPGAGTVHVKFKALCSRFSEDDSLAVMKVENRAQIVVGKYEALPPLSVDKPPESDSERVAVSMIDPNEIIALGHEIPVVIAKINYSPMQVMPSALVELLTCRNTRSAWTVTPSKKNENLQQRLIDIWGEMLSQALAERDLLTTGSEEEGFPATRKFFGKLLATYKNPHEVLGTPTDLTSREQLIKWWDMLRPGTTWERPLEAAYDDAAVYSVGGQTGGLKQGSAAAVFGAIMNELVNAINVLNELARRFTTPEKVKEHSAIWMLMMRAQQL